MSSFKHRQTSLDDIDQLLGTSISQSMRKNSLDMSKNKINFSSKADKR